MDFDEFIKKCKKDFYLEIGLRGEERLDPGTEAIVEAKFRQCYAAGYNDRDDRGNIRSVPVHMKDQFGNVLESFPSVRAAADFVQGDASNISRVLNSKQHTAYGYQWTYINEKNFS